MKTEILINHTFEETRVAFIENAQVQELHIERSLERGLVGNIYLGKVTRVLPGMQSAFVDIGLDKAAFLHNVNCGPRYPLRASESNQTDNADRPRDLSLSNQPIEKKIVEGQSLLVQVLKDPIANKGAKLTTQITLAGRYLVYLPLESQIGVSQKISPLQRETLRSLLSELLQVESPDTDSHEGFILRTNAENARRDELLQDMSYLRLTWHSIRQTSQISASKTLLHAELGLLERVLRDVCTTETQRVRVDSKLGFERLQNFSNRFMPHLQAKLEYYHGDTPLFDLANVDQAIARALAKRVDLKSGGYLVFDETEALITIDVNTGAFVGTKNFEDTILQTNLEAAQTIARELRLRNLGGIIIIDFIDMEREDYRTTVLDELRKKLQLDRVKTLVNDFSQLGLVEMTRKRSSKSLSQMLTQACTVCHGVGRVKSVRTIAYEILREIKREDQKSNPNGFLVVAHPNVAQALLTEESIPLKALSDSIAKPISLQAQPTLGQDDYDIVLL